MGIRLGLNAKLHRNTNTYGSPAWDEVTIVKDLTKNDSMQEADASVRGSGGFSFKEPTLRDLGFDFNIVQDVAHADYVALRSAYLNRTLIELRVSSSTTSGDYYTRAECKILKFDENQPLADIITVAINAKPCYSTNAIVDGTL